MSVMPSLYLSENVLSVITEMINDQNCRCIDKDSVPAYIAMVLFQRIMLKRVSRRSGRLG